ncbi:hypothetical protein [Variovorax sp. PBL-E5]|uniref:hypothetical protein n=1 Tax=Variovorax sp. PBL-E5 TaxID=434014 RepID=UPI001315C7F5|nr:hypothetical protein [Variovorax sp. PBL-E5]VTU37061.1 hypothetical protein E5CHR_04474 [Variovorax sp. PBL-E5]
MAKNTPAVAAVDETRMGETHTYPDGSSVVGVPPWPELSPIQRAQQLSEANSAEGPRTVIPEA